MPLFMDSHRDMDASVEDVAGAHEKDRETQENHGVNYLNYWMDEVEGACLFEGPSKDAGETVHREAHGLAAAEIFEVERGHKQA